MKQILQGIGFILIVIGGFWVGMQWWAITPTGSSIANHVVVPATPPVSDTSAVSPTTTEIPATTTPEPATQVTITAGIDNGETVDLPMPKNDKVNHYENTHFGYGFDVPANVYYSGFGWQGTALHTVGIAKDVPETFADSAIRIYFYGKKILPELQNGTTRYEDPAGKYVLLLLSNQTSVRIEANNIANPVVQKVIQTIAAI